MRERIFRMKRGKAFEPLRPAKWIDFFRFLKAAEEQIRCGVLRIEVAGFEEHAAGGFRGAAAVGGDAEAKQNADRVRVTVARVGEDFDSRFVGAMQKKFGSPGKQVGFAWVQFGGALICANRVQ